MGYPEMANAGEIKPLTREGDIILCGEQVYNLNGHAAGSSATAAALLEK